MSSVPTDMPQRIFLDSSTLQTLQNYGGFLYENEPICENDPIHRDRDGIAKLQALQSIMQIAERAPFEFALSENSFVEVKRRGDQAYLEWAYDVLDHWITCVDESGIPECSREALKCLDSSALGYLGNGDRALLRDAIMFGCDTFLTMENKLPKNSNHLRQSLGIFVESPCGVWARLRPWAALFR